MVCATIAYGMGIDKPSVRFVLHTSVAKSIEGYYQEAGRAGRDNLFSECIVFYKPSDIESLRQLMKIGKYKLSQKDTERLVEMKSYCEDEISCRRKQFHEKFGQIISDTNNDANKFSRCEDMCDNCRVRNGGKRRGCV